MNGNLTELLESLSRTDHAMKAEVHTANTERWADLCRKRDLIVTCLIVYANTHHAPKSA